MLKDYIDIYYFSGTGNTLVITQEVAKVLCEHGKTVSLLPIETSDPTKINIEHSIGFAFPVAIFATYPFVWEFFEKLPQGRGTVAFMLDTLAGFSGGIVSPLKKLLCKKHYIPLGAKEFIMPSNYGKIAPNEKNEAKKERALKKAKQYAESLLAGKTNWRYIPILPALIHQLSKLKIAWRKMGGQITIDQTRCTKCGLCAKLCPVKNITIEEGAFPKKGDRCYSCMRCVAFCPANAILFRGKQNRYRAVKCEAFLEQ